MVIFIYGSDSFRIHREVKKIKEKFISSSLGDTNLITLDASKTSKDEFSRQISALPFLSNTRLIILENALDKNSVTADVLDGIEKKTPKSTVLVIIGENPDKRLGVYKKLMKVSKKYEFNLLNNNKLKEFINSEVKLLGGKIEKSEVDKLIEYIGNDLWRMHNEIEKLAAYSSLITAENIELLIKSKIEADIFVLVDAIIQKKIKIALKEFYNLINLGANELYILSMIAYQYRNLLILKDTQTREKTNSSWILAKKSNVNPYIAQKIVPLLSRFEMEELIDSYGIILDFDIQIKTGKIDNRTALTLLIIKLINTKFQISNNK